MIVTWSFVSKFYTFPAMLKTWFSLQLHIYVLMPGISQEYNLAASGNHFDTLLAWPIDGTSWISPPNDTF